MREIVGVILCQGRTGCQWASRWTSSSATPTGRASFRSRSAGGWSRPTGIVVLHRRLVRAYEHSTTSSESPVYCAISDVIARRLTGTPTPA